MAGVTGRLVAPTTGRFDAAWQQYPTVKGAAAGALRELNCKHHIFLSPLGSTWCFLMMDESKFKL